jgi:hypothetical protein
LGLEDGLVHFSDGFDDLALGVFAIGASIRHVDAHTLDKNYFGPHSFPPDLCLLKIKKLQNKIKAFLYNNH